MKNIKLNILLSALSIIGLNSCDQDDSVDRVEKPSISVNKAFTIQEGEDVSSTTFDFKLSDRVRTVSNTNIGANVGAEISIRVVGGTATLGEDFTFNLPTVFDSGFGFWGGDGYYLNIPGETLTHTVPFSDIITIVNDNTNEETETIELLITPIGIAQASISQKVTITIQNRLVCPLDSTKFVGDYLIEQITPQLDGYTLSHNTVVNLSVVNDFTRVFDTSNYPNYCSTANPFQIAFGCTTVDIPVQSSNCACSGPVADWFKPAAVPSTIDLTNDTVFELTFSEDQADCSGPVAQTTYRFTKQ